MADVSRIRVELCKMNCRVHLKLPQIIKTGNELEFITCCDDFKKKLEVRFQEMLLEPSPKIILGRGNY